MGCLPLPRLAAPRTVVAVASKTHSWGPIAKESLFAGPELSWKTFMYGPAVFQKAGTSKL